MMGNSVNGLHGRGMRQKRWKMDKVELKLQYGHV